MFRIRARLLGVPQPASHEMGFSPYDKKTQGLKPTYLFGSIGTSKLVP
jgi:hypothetical protein